MSPLGDLPEQKKYLQAAMLTLSLCLAFVIMFSLLMDPYQLYPAISKYGPGKSIDLFYHLRLHKPYRIESVRPQYLIAGSSRSARFPPDSYQRSGGDAYNASLPGATLMELRRAIEHTHTLGNLSGMVIGLDYYMFQPESTGVEAFHEDARWKKPGAGIRQDLRHAYQHFEDSWRSLISVDSFMDSWRALRAKRASKQQYLPDGTWDIPIESSSSDWIYSSLAMQIFEDIKASEGSFDMTELENLLDFAYAEGIQVKLLITPLQGLLLQTTFLAGGWGKYLRWQRQLTMLVERRKGDVAIFGLENNQHLILEQLGTQDPLFRDGVHLTRKAGSEILRCLTSACEDELQAATLNARNIDDYLKEVDTLRLEYVKRNPLDIKKLHRSITVRAANAAAEAK